MFVRIFTIAAVTLYFAAPAVADCQEELNNLKQSTISAETGAATDSTGMPATKHQEEVLSGKQGTGTETSGSTTGAVEAISPHQKQVTDQPAGEPANKIGQLMSEARKMVDAGDEQGCMKKVSELKTLMGIK